MGSCSLPDRPLNLRKGRRRLAKGLAVSKRWGRRLTVIKCKSIQQFFFLETKRQLTVKTDVDCRSVIMRVRRTRRRVSFSRIYCNVLPPSHKECSFRKFQTHYSSKKMTLLPLITSTIMIENRVIYLVFWILNECIHIGTRKVISTEYFIGFIHFLCNVFLVYLVLL